MIFNAKIKADSTQRREAAEKKIAIEAVP